MNKYVLIIDNNLVHDHIGNNVYSLDGIQNYLFQLSNSKPIIVNEHKDVPVQAVILHILHDVTEVEMYSHENGGYVTMEMKLEVIVGW